MHFSSLGALAMHFTLKVTFCSSQNVEKRKLMLGVKVVSMLPQKFRVKCPEKALWCFLPVRGPVFLIN